MSNQHPSAQHIPLLKQLDLDTLLPEKVGMHRAWSGLHGAAGALVLKRFAESHSGLILLVTRDSSSAQDWQGALQFFETPGIASSAPVMHFPDWETLPYDAFSPHQDIISERLATLSILPTQRTGVLVVPITTLLQRITPRTYLAGAHFDFTEGQTFKPNEQRLILDAAGYTPTNTVTERGQYAVRGAVMDIFPMGAAHPIRIDLFDDEIDTLRTFDPDSQRTLERVSKMQLLPAKEFPFDEAAVANFRDQWHHRFNVDVRRCSIYQDVSSYIAPNGVEYYLPFFFSELGTLFDYLAHDTLCVLEQGAEQAAQLHWQAINSRYESLRHDVERPILPPSDLFLPLDQLHGQINEYRQIRLGGDGQHSQNFSSQPLPDLLSEMRGNQTSQPVSSFVAGAPSPVLFVAETAGRREVFDEQLSKLQIQTQQVDSFQEYLGQSKHCITIGDLQAGMVTEGCIIVTEGDVLGTRQDDQTTTSTRGFVDPDLIIRNLTELHIGAPVVHVEHGIGRYHGLQTLEIDGERYEFLTLGYAANDKLYVPVTSLHLISRYSGSDEESAPLHRLGSDQWDKAKRRAAEKVVDVAAELLDIYARRELKTSYQFDLNQAEYDKFCDEFPFEVTPDQQQAIVDTIADMTALRAMDRLICGDVGFGKTEVAMRAAFIAVQSGKQVALLVPTTLLAQQHFDTLKDRFASWPVQIATISRLRSDAEVEDSMHAARAGKVDILIGTHKLLSDTMSFKDLGLIIIDEEHRFGVRQKEKLKRLRAEVDVLTLTATPIPRTLNMAISGIRDLSIIATPPAKRLSIKTFVQEKRTDQIREAISRELLRGGQVFFLHNEVRTINQAADTIAALVPEARIGLGHGQMPKRELEHVMSDFYHRKLNVLVCTTIIETGIDIPNANTIIIERADKFGLAQLHQLRGRVGRSHRQAYAYLLTPNAKSMTADAVKRLQAIEDSGDLGVGFTLATQDMEIRGAGELLGDDQSGQIESIGFSLYMDLLNRAVNAIRAGKLPELDNPLEPASQEVNLHAATLIPEDYLPDVHTRLILYKRIANAKNRTELDQLQVEIIDRFGLLPEPLKRLFAVTELKLVGQELGVTHIDLGEERGRLEFSNQTCVDPIKIVNLVQRESHIYKLEGASKLRIATQMGDFESRLKFAHNLLTRLTPHEMVAA